MGRSFGLGRTSAVHLQLLAAFRKVFTALTALVSFHLEDNFGISRQVAVQFAGVGHTLAGNIASVFRWALLLR